MLRIHAEHAHANSQPFYTNKGF